jgi:hypothetical protein
MYWLKDIIQHFPSSKEFTFYHDINSIFYNKQITMNRSL